MNRRIFGLLALLVLAFVVAAPPSWTCPAAGPCKKGGTAPCPVAQSPAPRASASPAPAAPTFVSAEHGYSLRLPAGWRLEPDPNAVADTRFVRVQGARLSGSYQVFEGALLTDPTAWFDAARARYEAVAKSVPSIDHLEFSTLQPVRLGGQPAHTFEFQTILKNGGRILTRITFVMRPGPNRTDAHELIVIGEPAAFKDAAADLEALRSGVEFSGTRR